MRRRFGQILGIGIASDGVALVPTSRWRASAEVLVERSFDPHAGLEAIASTLRDLLAEAAPHGWPVSIVLSDELARIWQVTPPPACSRFADLEAAAALRFQGLYGTSAAGWNITADWDTKQSFLAAAVPEALLSVLVQAARDQRCHLVEVAPHFVVSMNRWRKLRRPGSWFGALHAGVLTLAAYDDRKLAAVRTVSVPKGADRAWLDEQIAREALRIGLARPEHLQLCGLAPSAWSSHEGHLKPACSLLNPGEGSELSQQARLASVAGRAP